MNDAPGTASEPVGRDFAGQVLRTFASRLLSLVIGVGAGILITRCLGVEGRGHYAVVISVTTLATSLGHLSVAQASSQVFAHEPRARTSLAANSVYFGLMWGAVVACVTYAVVIALGPTMLPIYATVGLVVGLAYVPVATATLWTQQSLLLRTRMQAFNYGPIISASLLLAGVGTLQATGHLTATTVIAVWAFSGLATLLVGAVSLRARPRDASLRLWWRTARSGVRYHPGMASFLLLMRIDVLMLNAMTDARRVGLYTLAVSVAELVNLVTNSVANVLVGKQYGGSEADAVRVTAMSARVNLLVGAALGLGLAAASPIVVPVVYGGDFRASVPALIALVPGVVTLAWARGIGAYFVRRNKPVTVSAIALGAATVNVAAILVLVPRWGIVGASLASSLAYGVFAGASVARFCRLAGIAARELLPSASDGRAVLALVRRTVGSSPWRA